MYDPRYCVGQTQYLNNIQVHQGSLKVPKQMNPGELEFEYLLAKLHWNYSRVSAEDVETLKQIVQKI